MLRRLLVVALLLGVFALGVLVARPRPEETKPPDPPALVERLREVARLETLEVSLYKKVRFSPEPQPTDRLWKDVLNWLLYTARAPEGRAIVFATAHLGYDFRRFDTSALHVSGTRVELVLPPLEVKVVLEPGETEVIGSNLDTAESAQLLELARAAFEREVLEDERLRARARASAEATLRALLLTLGFREVHLVERLPPVAHPG